jgi:hypothetical protein
LSIFTSCNTLLSFGHYRTVASAVTVHLGPLYTRSQGQCSTQIKHSYWCKSWNQPPLTPPPPLPWLYTRSQGQFSTQIKHSYWCKSWNQPPGIYLH